MDPFGIKKEIDFDRVPQEFQEAVERAKANHQLGDLSLLAAETRGLEWGTAGLRLVARAQIEKREYDGARISWEEIRSRDPSDSEANLALETIHQRHVDRNAQASLPELAAGAAVTASPERTQRRLLFTGHRVDDPGRKKPRFPKDKEAIARGAIKRAIQDELAAGAQIAFGIAGGASGGDILFHEVCEELGIQPHLYLALPRAAFIAQSVASSGPAWVERFDRLYDKLPVRVLQQSEELPGWLQAKPDYGLWPRNNLWMLHNALVGAASRVTLIALWDGGTGDGPGGTADLVEQAGKRGAKTVVLDTRALFGWP